MGGLNRSILAGRLVRDPELRLTKNEKAVARFTLAINWYGRTGKGTDFINCVAWGGLAEISKEYLTKGRLVAVEGHLSVKSYKDKSGKSKTSTEVVIENLQMLDSKFYDAQAKAKEDQAETIEI